VWEEAYGTPVVAAATGNINFCEGVFFTGKKHIADTYGSGCYGSRKTLHFVTGIVINRGYFFTRRQPL